MTTSLKPTPQEPSEHDTLLDAGPPPGVPAEAAADASGLRSVANKVTNLAYRAGGAASKLKAIWQGMVSSQQEPRGSSSANGHLPLAPDALPQSQQAKALSTADDEGMLPAPKRSDPKSAKH
jgi:hypothetical protein